MSRNILAVTGNPVLHSLSPVLMNAAIKANDIDFRYLRLPALSAEEAMQTFKMLGFKGMNVTAPFKKDIMQYLDCLTDNARKAEAVNCVYVRDGKYWGDNTDITGVELSIKMYPEFLKDGKMLVIGSGGASNGVIIAGQNLGLKVTVCARNLEALKNLKAKYGVETADLSKVELLVRSHRIIVQALPHGAKVFDPSILLADSVILDANYKDSIFEEPAKKIGYKFLSGKNWLVNQAIPAFETFTGSRVSADVMYKALDDYNFDYRGRIALTGFMGVGKTTAGRELAKKMNYRFIDMDVEIEKQEGMKIKEIFATKGEEYFREVETAMLEKYADEVDVILSCGGGTIKSDINRAILREKFVNLWLYATAAYCIDGLDVSNRPLLQCENPAAAAEKMLQERIPMYVDGAYGIINVMNLNRYKTASKIYDQIVETFGI